MGAGGLGLTQLDGGGGVAAGAEDPGSDEDGPEGEEEAHDSYIICQFEKVLLFLSSFSPPFSYYSR